MRVAIVALIIAAWASAFCIGYAEGRKSCEHRAELELSK